MVKNALVFLAIMFCAVNTITAQSFESLKRVKNVSFNQQLADLIAKNDVNGMKIFLRQNASQSNQASSTKEKDGLKGKIQMPVPLLYDVVEKCLTGQCSVEMCQVIVDANADVNCNFEEKTPIYVILDYIIAHPIEECGDAEKLVKIFLSAPQFDVNFKYQSLPPPLSYLTKGAHIYHGDFKKGYVSENIVKMLIDKGASVNTYDRDGNSLINFAIVMNYSSLQEYLIDRGVDIGKTNKEGNDVMYIAIEQGSCDAIIQILSTGYDLNIHSLKNDPNDFRKYEDVYNLVSEKIAGKAITIDDIILFLGKFRNRFDLVKTKFYAFYDKDFEYVIKEREGAIRYLSGENGYWSGSKSCFQFKKTYSSFDPDSRCHLADEVVMLDGCIVANDLVVSDSYISAFRETIITSLMSKEPHNARRTHESRTVEYGIGYCDRLVEKNAFNKKDYFISLKANLVKKYQLIEERYRRDLIAWREQKKIDHNVMMQRMCDECEIVWERTDLPRDISYGDEVIDFFFSRQEPGTIYMKNGEEYSFWTTDDGKLEISSGFLSKKKFDHPVDMLIAFLEKCKETYCR